jgi:hypothetical protein
MPSKRRECEFEEEPLSLPPHVVETDIPRDDQQPPDHPTHTPGGELHTLSPSAPEDEQQLSEPPKADDIGGVPLSYGNVPTSYVRGQPDHVEFEEQEPMEAPPFVTQDRTARKIKSPPSGPRAPVAVEQE